MIKNREVSLIINTPSGRRDARADDCRIRQNAIKYKVPYLTTLAAARAASEGIVNGMGDGRFDPDSPLTREQMYKITALCGALLGVGRDAEPDVLDACPDRDRISSWAIPGTAWCRTNGLFFGGGTVGPQKTVSRGEAAVLFAALAKMAGKA